MRFLGNTGEFEVKNTAVASGAFIFQLLMSLLPVRVPFACRGIGQAFRIAAVSVDQVEFPVAVTLRHKGDLAAVG